MAEPKHPKTIVVQNKYYPIGLTEEKVWLHYSVNKDSIIKEVNKRPVILFVFVDTNRWIVKRNINNATITLTNNSYDKLITGRTVSVSVEREKLASYLCIDIDPGEKVTEIQLKDCIEDILNSAISKSPLINNHRIVSTAKSYHVYFYLRKKMNINSARSLLEKILTMDFSDRYLINKKGPTKGNKINLDLTPTMYRGSHTVMNALCRNGLIAMDVTDTWKSFNHTMAILK
jgi:hypothetical protein